MITELKFLDVVRALGAQGRADISWAADLQLPATSEAMAREIIFVICNSGMRHTVAQQIYTRCMTQLELGRRVELVFGHKGKAGAIEYAWGERETLFAELQASTDLVEFCGELPWIGPITKYHLAKNFGAQVAKPDVHLQRLADLEGATAQDLCERLARRTGYNVATVDTLLWRACATGVLSSHTGELLVAA